MRRYAVLFKTHFWDETVRARYDQVCQAAQSGDVIVFVDETRGAVAVESGILTARRTTADCERRGLAMIPEAAAFWYNTDYPLYLAAETLAGYDYVLMTEYDCALHLDLDAMIERARAGRVDFAASSIRTPIEIWPWTPSVNGVFPPGSKLAHLTCVCLLSRSAWQHLYARRLRLAEQYRLGVLQGRREVLAAAPAAGVVESWPFSEAFMGSELALAGFNLAGLEEFGPTGGYDWWPPHLASQLSPAANPGFFHPVLDGARYVDSLLRLHPSPADWFDPQSDLRTRLELCDRATVLMRLSAEFIRRNQAEDRRRLRDAVGAQEWIELDLGCNECSTPHPSTCSRLGERPQWWAVDLERPAATYRIRLFEHDNPIQDTGIEVQAMSSSGAWIALGCLTPGQQVLDIRLDPPAFIGHIRLLCDSVETLRTGRLEVMVDC